MSGSCKFTNKKPTLTDAHNTKQFFKKIEELKTYFDYGYKCVNAL